MLRGKPQQLTDWTGQAAGRSVGRKLSTNMVMRVRSQGLER